MSILSVSSVTKNFSGIVALDNVSLDLQEKEVLGLIGPNGAGKTTLFNIIAGYYKPSSGKVIYAGRDITGLQPYKICKLGIARTFQIPKPFPDMKVIDHIKVARNFGTKKNEKINSISDTEICNLVGLGEKKDVEARYLNVSEKKRLEVARAIATSPKILLFDEIGAGLTPSEGTIILGLIERLSGDFGLSIIWVEHVMRILMKGVHRVVVLNHGVKIAEGKPEEIVNDERVQQAYLGGRL